MLTILYMLFAYGGKTATKWNVLITDPTGIMADKIASRTDSNIRYSFADNYIEMEEFGVDMWLTSKEGCKFHIVGDVSWGGSFSGTVTGTSGEPCPNGEWTFGIAAPGGNIQISGDEEIVDFLHGEPGMVREMAVRMELVE